MRSNKANRSNGDGTALPPVHLEFIHPTAGRVYVAGTFNDWRTEATPMVAIGEGRWIKELALPPGVYEYRFVVDGEWIPDPLARETTLNPFGGLNSVLKVAARHLAGHQVLRGSPETKN